LYKGPVYFPILALADWSPKWDCPLNYNDTNIAYEISPFSDVDEMVRWRNVLRISNLYVYPETIIVDILVLEILLQVHSVTMVL
jgi:hypothetical protein